MPAAMARGFQPDHRSRNRQAGSIQAEASSRSTKPEALDTRLPIQRRRQRRPIRRASQGGRAALVDATRDGDRPAPQIFVCTPTPAHIPSRHSVWLVFDSTKPLDVEQSAQRRRAHWDVSRCSIETGQAIRIRLNRPQCRAAATSARAAPTGPLTFADSTAPPRPLKRDTQHRRSARANVAVPLSTSALHRLNRSGCPATRSCGHGAPPMRASSRQDFVELSLLESLMRRGVHPNSDDVGVESPPTDHSGRPGGLTLSSAGVAASARATVVGRSSTSRSGKKIRRERFVAREEH